jgi:L-2-hydroxyglutarate oxidase LhgO
MLRAHGIMYPLCPNSCASRIDHRPFNAHHLPMAPETTDAVVIGAGVIGLAVARSLALSGREVLVLEANPGIGQGISSRSSEVIHAGLYYEPDSLKARSCVRGKALLYEYCESKGVPHRRIGKLIVATDEAQVGSLEGIRNNAANSGVTDLEWVDRPRLVGMEPAVRARAALWSPSTGIIDSHALMLALQADLEAAGATVALNSKVTAGRCTADGCELTVASGGESTLAATLVVNAAGLHSTDLAAGIDGMPAKAIPQQYFVSGHYFTYPGKAAIRHLVYPVPDPVGLGIHATLDMAGQLRFGPDAEHCDGIDYRFEMDKKPLFSASVRRWLPGLDEDRMQPGYVGIRPKLSGPGRPDVDFMISGPDEHGVPGLVHLFGIESPGLTACLALAEEVAARCA